MIHLLLAIHNHQPVGNFEHIFEKAFKECYWPLINTIAEFPKIKVSLHHSGPLLDWTKGHEPKYITTLVKMIESGQVEPLGGGYYEPILSIIPPVDAAGQIKMMRDFWEVETGISPKGIWMTERIWEPSLTTLLADNGVEYTILDDEHFRAAGITDEFILNYYLTERHGKTVAVFASDQTLRYKIPFRTPEDVIGHLLWLGEKFPGVAVTYGDDGEKFGLWPGTFEWVVQKGWLKKFFRLLSENSEKIGTTTISEFLSKRKPAGTVYLPACSYHEMGEWAMPAHAIHKFEGIKQFLINNGKWDDAKAFVRGGYWDNFLTKYPEANYMHKRMLYVSRKIADAGCGMQDAEKLKQARKVLYRAQCNCAYWHGLFGGLYLNYLRHAVYQNLIEAENIIDKVGTTKTSVTITDIDCDSEDEVILSNKNLIAVLKPSSCASIVELSHRRSGLNLMNVLARREEAYHKKSSELGSSQSKEGEIASIHNINKPMPNQNPLSYDPCARHSFCDHLWPAAISHRETNAGKGNEIEKLCRLPYDLTFKDRDSVTLNHKTADGLSVQKKFKIFESGVSAKYSLVWDKPIQSPLRFGTELNLTLLAGHDKGRYFLLPSGERQLMDFTGSIEDADKLTLVDEYFKFRLETSSDKKMDVWCYPVQTISQSESGFDLLYQGSCIIFSSVVTVGTDKLDFALTLEFK